MEFIKIKYCFGCCLSLAYIVFFNLSCYNKNNQLLGNKGAFSGEVFPALHHLGTVTKCWIYWAGAAILALILLIIFLLFVSASAIVGLRLHQNAPMWTRSAGFLFTPNLFRKIPEDVPASREPYVMWWGSMKQGNPSPGADAQAHSSYLMEGGDGSTSWHYTVDDKQIYHHVPRPGSRLACRRQDPGRGWEPQMGSV